MKHFTLSGKHVLLPTFKISSFFWQPCRNSLPPSTFRDLRARLKSGGRDVNQNDTDRQDGGWWMSCWFPGELQKVCPQGGECSQLVVTGEREWSWSHDTLVKIAKGGAISRDSVCKGHHLRVCWCSQLKQKRYEAGGDTGLQQFLSFYPDFKVSVKMWRECWLLNDLAEICWWS